MPVEISNLPLEQQRRVWLGRKYMKIWKVKAIVLRHKREAGERRARLQKKKEAKAAKLEKQQAERLHLEMNAQRIVERAEGILTRWDEAKQAERDRDLERESVAQPSPQLPQTPHGKLRVSILRHTPTLEPSKTAKRVHFSLHPLINTLPAEETLNERQPEASLYAPPRPLSGDPLRQSANDPLPAQLSTVRSGFWRLKSLNQQHLSPSYYKNSPRYRAKRNLESTSVLPMPSTSQHAKPSPQNLDSRESLLSQSFGSQEVGQIDTPESPRKRVRFDKSVGEAHMEPTTNDLFGASLLNNGPPNPLQRIPGESILGKRKFASSTMDHVLGMPPASFTSPLDPDEELIARAEAVRSRMAWRADVSRNLPGDSLNDQSQLIHNLHGSELSDEGHAQKKVKLSSSMDRAQADMIAVAKERLPAYWMRESHFVPRSEYGLGPKSKRVDFTATSGASASSITRSGPSSRFFNARNTLSGISAHGFAATIPDDQVWNATNDVLGSQGPTNSALMSSTSQRVTVNGTNSAAAKAGEVIDLLSSDGDEASEDDDFAMQEVDDRDEMEKGYYKDDEMENGDYQEEDEVEGQEYEGDEEEGEEEVDAGQSDNLEDDEEYTEDDGYGESYDEGYSDEEDARPDSILTNAFGGTEDDPIIL